jgi:hypothetical protein
MPQIDRPRFIRTALTLAAVACLSSPAHPEEARSGAEIDSLRAEVEALKRQVARLSGEVLPDTAVASEKGPFATGKRPAVPKGVYDKPFLRRFGRATAVGGYMDHEFIWTENTGNTFTQHRFIPFVYGEVADRVHVASEIEFEYGGFVRGAGGTDGEIKLEFATFDFTFNEGLNFRGGVLLSPLGKLNLVHDSPINDLTDRPLVDSQIIPTTLSESGVGLFGTAYPTERALLSYEVYLVNGFNERVIDGGGRLRVRGGRGSQRTDNNRNKALLGRVGLSPRLGVDFGASFHTGKYDALDRYRLSIVALDAQVVRGPFEFLGEYARVFADGDRVRFPNLAEAQQGYYLQGNLHFGHDRLLKGSVFTGVARWDFVDFDADVPGDDQSRMTLGLNFRPVEDAAFKFDYQWNWTTARNATTRASAPNRFLFSVASYF